MHDLNKLMSLIPLLIDLVAEYVPSQEAKKVRHVCFTL